MLIGVPVVAGCGGSTCPTGGNGCQAAATTTALNVQPQNSTLVVGINRISIALLDGRSNPVAATNVTAQVIDRHGRLDEVRPLENISPVYGGIPIYVGTAKFASPGQYEYVVHGSAAGSHDAVGGHAYVTVATSGPELAVGARVPPINQAVVTAPGVTLAMVDSGVPPDTWHDVTIAQALSQHRPMVLFFGQPGYCPSKTCGPTVSILRQLCAQYCTSFSFQHIETDFPASAAQTFDNPAFRAFGLQSDPWVYFVNSAGIVADRFEGPVTLDELRSAAEGTLTGHVPAVDLGQ